MIKPVYALVGSDPFLQLEALRDIVAGFGKEAPQRTDFEGDRAALADVLDELRCFSMFSSSKLVVIRDADDFVSRHRDGLEKFLSALGDSPEPLGGGAATLVLRMGTLPANQKVYKLITKAGEVRKCEPPALRDLPAWLMKRAKSVHHVEIELAAANQLAELIGDDMGRLDTELAKLAIGCDGARIRPENVAASVAFQREQEVKEVTALLGRGRPREAVVRWRQLVQSDPAAEFKAVTWLAIWLEKARTAVRMKEKNLPPAQIGGAVWIRDPVELKEFIATASRLGRPGVARLMDDLTTLDRRTKSGLGSAAEAVERFIATALPD